MGKTILTPKQFEFLELVKIEPQITKLFYLTGGTALSEFHLKHRLSEDLDFFTEEKEVNQKLIEAYLKKVSVRLSIKEINHFHTRCGILKTDKDLENRTGRLL